MSAKVISLATRKKLAKAMRAQDQATVPPPWRPTQHLLSQSRRKLAKDGAIPNAFTIPKPAPGVVPPRKRTMARDNQIIEINAWAAQQVYNGAFFNGVTFMGYTYLSELAQRPEYRRFSEVLSTEMTRKWIKFNSVSTDKTVKAKTLIKIKQLEKKCKELNLKGVMRKMVEGDGFFGRMHLYIDTGSTDDREELRTPIGDGYDQWTELKFKDPTTGKIKLGFLQALKPIEPVWCYPAFYNANDPLKFDWYNPQTWFVQGKEIHSTRLLTFVGREVPDLLKPSYAFGGLSLSQMAKPTVDNWLRTRDAVGDLVYAFSTWVLKTDLASYMESDGSAAFDRVELFNNFKNNLGTFLIDKNSEEFENVSTNLGSLSDLQSQSQEHMCSVTGIPVVKLLGIQPAGLNASSEGELTVWYEWVEAFQKRFFDEHLERILRFIQLSLWGEVDENITYIWEPLRSLSALEASTKRKTDAETGGLLISEGVIDPSEERARLASDPESPYSGLDEDLEEPLGAMHEEPDEEQTDEPRRLETDDRREPDEGDDRRTEDETGRREQETGAPRRPTGREARPSRERSF